MKKILAYFAVLIALSSVALAAPIDKTDGFVCPVIHSDAVGIHNPNAVPIAEGDYTIVGPRVSVPLTATNGDGTGTPGGSHSGPGDTNHTAVWAGQ